MSMSRFSLLTKLSPAFRFRPFQSVGWTRVLVGSAVLALGCAVVALGVYPKARIVARTVVAIQAEQTNQSAQLTNIQANQSAQLANIQAEIAKLQTSLAEFKVEASNASEPSDEKSSKPVAQPLIRDRPQLKEWAFLDDVDVYQKAGLIEVYGGVLTQKRAGAIAVRSAILTPSAQKSWLVWSPDYSPLVDAQQIELALDDDTVEAGTLTIGVILDDGTFTGWTARLGPDMPPNASLEVVKVPSDIAEPVGRAGPLRNLRAVGRGHYVGDLPALLKAVLGGTASAKRTIKAWVLTLEGATPGEISVRRVAFKASTQSIADSAISNITGQVRDVSVAPGDSIELILENNEVRSSELAFDGSFAFADVPTRFAASLRYRFKARDYYASFGRWFRPLAGTMAVNVFVRPEFNNPEGKEPNAAEIDIKSEFDSEDGRPTIFRYERHRRTVWPGGAGSPREFVGRSFVNNFGFPDRDRSFENRDRCLRIGAVGGSTFVALQVKTFEKFNIVLEGELGRRLGRCVEVISAGRDNGDIAANYRVIRDYVMKFQPDVVLIEHMLGLATQMEPRILKSTLGWSYEHNVLDNFYFDPSGKLTFRSWDTSWALDAVAPSADSLIPNLGIFDSFSIPYADFAPEAKASFDLFAAIARKLSDDYPKTRFVMATGHDQAGCQRNSNCDGTFTMPDGRVVKKGVRQLVENFSKLCEQAAIDCVQPPIPSIAPAADENLMYASDSHYSIRGHQWLAKNFAEQLDAILSKPRPQLVK